MRRRGAAPLVGFTGWGSGAPLLRAYILALKPKDPHPPKNRK